MRFADIVGEIKRKLGDVTTETTTAIELAINNYYFELWNKNLWWFARRDFYFDTIAPYSTGTITVTSGSASVTGSGTTFTSAMVGRKLVVSGDNLAYTVKTFTSTTAITLDTVYKGTGGSGQSYKIYKSVYRLDDRVQKVLWIKQMYSPFVLKELPERQFDLYRTNPYNEGDVDKYCLRGQTTAPYYNTGTIAVANGSASVTGSGTTWTSDMIGMIFKASADDIEYTVLSVASTTSLTLNKVYDGTTIASLGTYEIGSAGTEQIEVDPLPDKVEQLRYKAQLRPLKLVADNDVPELPYQWHSLLIEGGFMKVATGRVDNSIVEISSQLVTQGEDSLMKWHNASEDENPTILPSYNRTNARNINDKFII